jgi:hypothetical protein
MTVTTTFKEKISTIFDKDNFTEAEFFQLIDFLTRGEDLQNVRWVTKKNFLYPLFTSVKVEEAFYSDHYIGLKIYVPA